MRVKTTRGNVAPFPNPQNGCPAVWDAHYCESYFIHHDRNEVLDTRLRDLVLQLDACAGAENNSPNPVNAH